MKFATKPIQQYPSHLRHVATLPWEIKNSNVLQTWKKMKINCTLIALTLLFILPNFDMFGVYNSKSFSVLIMVALCNRENIYIFMLWFVLSFFFFFSSPNLSHRRLDVCHTSTHGVALVRI